MPHQPVAVLLPANYRQSLMGISSILPLRSIDNLEENFMKPMVRIATLFALLVAFAGLGYAQDSQSPSSDQSTSQGAKQDMKNAGHATKNAAKDTGKGVKTGAKDAGNATKTGAKDTGNAAKKTGHSIKTGTKKVTNKGAQKTEEGSQKVEDKTQQ
jgi:hypothetical protein